MPLYFITGISGAGKSTVLAELKRQGHEAYDVDEAGPATAKWHHDTTGFVHPKSSVKSKDRTPEFLANHSWKVPRLEVAALAEKATAKPIFLGGSIANELDLQDLFHTVFALAINDNTMKRRLVARTNNDWGKSPYELEQTLAANRELDEKYKRLGYMVIDASQPADVIVGRILAHVHDNQ